MLTDRFPPEVRSAAHLFYDLAREFQSRGHDVVVISKVPTGYLAHGKIVNVSSGWSVVDGVPTFRSGGFPLFSHNPFIRGLGHLTMAWVFWRSSRRWPKADVVLVSSPPLPLAVVGAKYHRRFGAPFVLNVQDLYPQTAVDLGLLKNHFAIMLAEQMERRTYARAAKIVVHSPGNKEFLVKQRGVQEEKVQVIFNWVNTDIISPRPFQNSFRMEHGLTGKFVVSYAGIMGYAQDLTSVLQCAALMRGEKGVIFLLCGEGVFEPRWRQMAREQNLENVLFLPMQQRDQYLDLLAASDVCLVPLSADLRTPVVPGKLQSIMASGRPVIAIVPPEADAREIIQESGGGLIVEPEKPVELLTAINYLRMNPSVREEMASRGRIFAEIHFSLKVAADVYESLFQELLGRRFKGDLPHEGISPS